MKLRDKSPILICIDLQQGFLDEEYWGGDRNNKDAELICRNMLSKWRELELEVIHVRHSSSNPLSKLHKDNEGFLFNPLVQPLADEIIITKSVNSAFIGTNLKELIDSKDCQTLVIVGLTTDHCVSTTTRMAGNYGYDVYLISDATATFATIGVSGGWYSSELIHATALASLNDEFATVIDSNRLINLL